MCVSNPQDHQPAGRDPSDLPPAEGGEQRGHDRSDNQAHIETFHRGQREFRRAGRRAERHRRVNGPAHGGGFRSRCRDTMERGHSCPRGREPTTTAGMP